MKLSQTTHAQPWLDQFEVDDQAAAIALLDSIRFVPTGVILAGVRDKVENFIWDNSETSPTAIVPVISEEDMLQVNRSLNGDPIGYSIHSTSAERPLAIIQDLEKIPEDHSVDLKVSKKSLAGTSIVFKHFDPEQRIDPQPGSEAIMSNLIREVSRGTLSKDIVGRPMTLETLRNKQVRTLLCITDYIGSGQQVLSYVNSWYRHPTIKSWISFGWLKIVVVAYAATITGKQAVEQHPYIDEIQILESVRQLGEIKRSDQQGKIERLCQIYAKRGKLNQKAALGYQNSGGLFASPFSVPNNLPAILIGRSKRWKPFFDGRSVPSALAKEIGNYGPEADVAQRLEAAGQSKLAERHRDKKTKQRWRSYTDALALMPRTEDELAQDLSVDLQTVRVILGFLERAGFLDNSGKPTPTGLKVLQSHRKKPRRVSAMLEPGTSPYYPGYAR